MAVFHKPNWNGRFWHSIFLTTVMSIIKYTQRNNFTTELESNGISFGSESFVKWLIQFDLGLIQQDSEKMPPCVADHNLWSTIKSNTTFPVKPYVLFDICKVYTLNSINFITCEVRHIFFSTRIYISGGDEILIAIISIKKSYRLSGKDKSFRIMNRHDRTAFLQLIFWT